MQERLYFKGYFKVRCYLVKSEPFAGGIKQNKVASLFSCSSDLVQCERHTCGRARRRTSRCFFVQTIRICVLHDSAAQVPLAALALEKSRSTQSQYVPTGWTSPGNTRSIRPRSSCCSSVTRTMLYTASLKDASKRALSRGLRRDQLDLLFVYVLCSGVKFLCASVDRWRIRDDIFQPSGTTPRHGRGTSSGSACSRSS